MTAQENNGPRIGDVVKVEVSGPVIEMETRNGVPGVLVELDTGGVPCWRPLDDAVVTTRRPAK